MSKHTPGPWNTQSDPCHWNTISTVVAGERMIVHVGGCCEPAEQEANARLIAAAPDLLEALDAMRTELFFYAKGNYFRPLLDKAGDALMKARGEI